MEKMANHPRAWEGKFGGRVVVNVQMCLLDEWVAQLRQGRQEAENYIGNTLLATEKSSCRV